MIEILLTDETGKALEKDIRLIESVVQEAARFEGYGKDGEVSILLVGDQEIRKINAQFRQIDRVTDVLSFPIMEFTEGGTLGDIVLSLERAAEQAEEYGHSYQRELAFLTVHAMLHLLGYDHETKEEEEIMAKKQEEILEELGITREGESH